jgi:hypothetical protein
MKTSFVPAAKETKAFEFDELKTTSRVKVVEAESVPMPVSQAPLVVSLMQ